jgi:hypothetical protein
MSIRADEKMICLRRTRTDEFRQHCDFAIYGFGMQQREAIGILGVDFEPIGFAIEEDAK